MLSLSGGQSLEDKLYAIKYFISGQGLSYVVLKATTSELMGSKKKHLNYLVNITHEPNVSIPSLVKYLMQRSRHPEWTVVFKSLLTTHHLMNYGNEKFIQNLASSTVNHRSFDRLSSFNDCSSSLAYDMSTFLRRYSRYISSKIQTYRLLGFEFCQATANSQQTQSKMRKVQADQLTKTLTILQSQFDTLMAFDATTKDLSNGIINSAFAMLYKDFVKLYITYQSAVIRLLELFFSISSPKCARGLLDCYKKFLIRMDKTSDFLRIVNMLAMDTSDMPSLSRALNLPLGSLEKQLQLLESNHKRTYQVVSQAELPRIEYTTLDRRRDSRNSIGRSPNIARTRKRAAESGSAAVLGQSASSDKRRRDGDNGPGSTTSPADGAQYLDSQLLLDSGWASAKQEEPDLMVLDEDEPTAEGQERGERPRLDKQQQQQTNNIVRTTPFDWVQVEL